MCRLLFYVSPQAQINLDFIINQACNSLVKQAYTEPYLPNYTHDDLMKRNAVTHLDGYGVLYRKDRNRYTMIKSHLPIVDDNKYSNDINRFLYKNIENVETNFFLGFIRKNNLKTENRISDVQPLQLNNIFFMHNGEFNKSVDQMRPFLESKISQDILSNFKLDLDSKLLFALVMTYLKCSHSVDFIKTQIKEVINLFIKAKTVNVNMSLNFIYADLGLNVFIAVRYRTCDEEPPSLYYNNNFYQGICIASEPVDNDNQWQLMQNQIIVIIKDERYIYDL